MEIYLVIIEDRHIDVMVYPFTEKEKAISEAKRVAGEYEWEEQDCKDSDRLFWATHPCESDCLRVVAAKIDGSIS